jgi:hypothetical protein
MRYASKDIFEDIEVCKFHLTQPSQHAYYNNVIIAPPIKPCVKAPRIFANMRDAETAHTGGMKGFREQSRLVKRPARRAMFSWWSNITLFE